jgi:hypothetical protein
MTRLEQLSDADLTTMLQRARALPDAPAAWVDRAIAMFPTQPRAEPLARQVGRVLQQVVASLRIDSWAPQPGLAMALRSTANLETRHLLFNAAGRDIDLRISTAGQGFEVCGQILGPDETGAVALVRLPRPDLSSNETHMVRVDDLGEFRIGGLSAGTFALTFRMGDDEITLPPIELGDRPQ